MLHSSRSKIGYDNPKYFFEYHMIKITSGLSLIIIIIIVCRLMKNGSLAKIS